SAALGRRGAAAGNLRARAPGRGQKLPDPRHTKVRSHWGNTMEGGRSILGFPAWLGACRGRVLACGLLATSAVVGASPVWADDSALLRSLAQRFDSPAKVFTEDENAVSLSQTAEPRRMYVRQVEQPPALGLEI